MGFKHLIFLLITLLSFQFSVASTPFEFAKRTFNELTKNSKIGKCTLQASEKTDSSDPVFEITKALGSGNPQKKPITLSPEDNYSITISDEGNETKIFITQKVSIKESSTVETSSSAILNHKQEEEKFEQIRLIIKSKNSEEDQLSVVTRKGKHGEWESSTEGINCNN